MLMKRMKTLINDNAPFDMGLEGLSIMATMPGHWSVAKTQGSWCAAGVRVNCKVDRATRT
jgi:hypothetical protein